MEQPESIFTRNLISEYADELARYYVSGKRTIMPIGYDPTLWRKAVNLAAKRRSRARDERLRISRGDTRPVTIQIILTAEEYDQFSALRAADHDDCATFAKRALLTGAKFTANRCKGKAKPSTRKGTSPNPSARL